MTEATKFAKYRVLPQKKGRVPIVGVEVDLIAFDTDLRFGVSTEFEGDLLRERYGKRWSNRLARELKRYAFRIVGVDRDDSEHLIRLDELGRFLVERTEIPEVQTDRATRVVDMPRSGRRKGSGVDTLVRHLRLKEQVKAYPDVVRVLELIAVEDRTVAKVLEGWGQDNANKLDGAKLAYARGKEPHDKACPYCESGLPTRISSAIRSVIES